MEVRRTRAWSSGSDAATLLSSTFCPGEQASRRSRAQASSRFMRSTIHYALASVVAISCCQALSSSHPAASPARLGGPHVKGFVPSFSSQSLPFIKGNHRALQLPRLSLPKISTEGICNLLAGGVAGAFAAALTCPLEVVKTQLQSRANAGLGLSPLAVAAKIVNEQGVKGLYRGLTPTMVGIVPTRSCYFWAYSAAKSALGSLMGEGPLTHMLSAVAAGGLSNTVTCPLWMVKTRMQLSGGSLVATAQRIVRDEGVKGLYRGLLASYWGLSEGALQFLIYEHLKHDLARRNAAARAAAGTDGALSAAQGAARREAPLSTMQYLAAAGLSKGVASALTYPHEVVRTRMRECGGSQYRGMLQSLRLIAREEGRRGLYGGLGPHLMRVVPNTAIMFVSYELLRHSLPAILEDPSRLAAAPRRAGQAVADAVARAGAAVAAVAAAPPRWSLPVSVALAEAVRPPRIALPAL